MPTRDFQPSPCAGDGERIAGRRRLLCSLLASIALNAIAWITLTSPARLSFSRSFEAQAPREIVQVTIAKVRIEHRAVRVPKPPAAASPARSALRGSQEATIDLPPGWSGENFGDTETTHVTMWLDWKEQTADFVPRVFLWQVRAPAEYMREATLRDAVRSVLDSLSAEGDAVHASRPQLLCDGKRRGWFFSYDKPGDSPPMHVDETLFLASGTIYKATYIRPAGAPEDRTTRNALYSLCSRT
jgi:hypothetical protein